MITHFEDIVINQTLSFAEYQFTTDNDADISIRLQINYDPTTGKVSTFRIDGFNNFTEKLTTEDIRLWKVQLALVEEALDLVVEAEKNTYMPTNRDINSSIHMRNQG